MSPEAVCVACGRRPVDPAWRPFCSERCKLIGLGRWLGGEYRIPGPGIDAADEDAEEQDER